MPTKVTTSDVSEKERPHYWNYLVSSVLGRLNTIPQRRGVFNGSLAYASLSTIPIATVASSPVHVERKDAFIDNPSEDFYKINFILEGSATISQQNRSAELSSGQWTIYDNTRPYDLRIHSDYKQLLLLIPRAQLLKRLPAIDLFLARSFDSNHGMSKLLIDYTLNALHETDGISAGAQDHASQILLDMLLLGLTDAAGNNSPLPSPGRFKQMKQFILSHLCDTNLSVEMLANHFNLSKRAVQKTFSKNATTVNQEIWYARIEQCKKELSNPLMSTVPIQDIALSWGFRTNAHFSRMFKEKTSLTPRQYRTQVLNSKV